MQSNNQSNLLFYQNNDKSTNIELKRKRISELLSIQFDKCSAYKITWEQYQRNVKRLRYLYINLKEDKKEIQEVNEVTPTTATKTISNDINTLSNQINRLTKLNSYATFLQKRSNKKSFYKYREILLSIRNKTDLKQRVLNLLLWEKERIIKVT